MSIVVLNILFYLFLSIALFDLDYAKSKSLDDPELPQWIGLIDLVLIISWIFLLFVGWKFAFIGFVVYLISSIIPIPQMIGNILMSPFKPKKIGKVNKIDKKNNMFNFNIIKNFKLKFNFSKKHSKDNRRAGVISEGENATFIDCKGIGPDAGIIDKGKKTTSINSEWESSNKKYNKHVHEERKTRESKNA